MNTIFLYSFSPPSRQAFPAPPPSSPRTRLARTFHNTRTTPAPVNHTTNNLTRTPPNGTSSPPKTNISAASVFSSADCWDDTALPWKNPMKRYMALKTTNTSLPLVGTSAWDPSEKVGGADALNEAWSARWAAGLNGTALPSSDGLCSRDAGMPVTHVRASRAST
jgi:hypothetical protein